MSIKPSDGIGERLARYRRLSGYSARELAERAGTGLTRGVIANIESGRKSDITVDQLIALSTVLGIPPVALALPLDRPYAFVRLTDSPGALSATRVYKAMDWFMGVQVLFPGLRRDDRDRDTSEISDNEATLLSETLIEAIGDHPKRLQGLEIARRMFEEGHADEQQVRSREAELQDLERTLRGLGVNLKMFKIDE